MCTYNQLKNGEKTLQQVEEDKKKKKIKSQLNGITSGNPKLKSEKRSYTIENVKNLYDSR